MTGAIDSRAWVKQLEGLLRVDVGGERDEIAAHHVAELREPVEARRVVFGEHPDRVPIRVDDHHRTVGALVDEPERVADRVGRCERDRRLEHRMAGLDEPDHGLDHVDGDVLREHGDAATPSDHLRHAPPGHRRHVRHHERDGGADTIGCGEIDPEPRSDSRQVRHHEHVVVREVVTRVRMQHPHGRIRLTAPSRRPTLRTVTVPVVLVHGWGGSFASTWERSGFTALLADAGRDVVGVDLLGHGTAPKPHEPAAYADLTARIVEALPEGPVDAVGFSLGALTLLRTAIATPERFRRLVLAGIGRNVFERDDAATARILAGVEGTGEYEHDNLARLFGQYARIEGNDAVALAAVLRRPDPGPITPVDIGRVTCPVLVALGDHDFAQPADALVDALPNARFVALRNTDHFATPESFAFIDAVLDFLDAVPT